MRGKLQYQIVKISSIPLSSRDWTVFIMLQSVDGEDLKLTQATQVVLSLFSSIKEDLGMEVNITEVTRFGKNFPQLYIYPLSPITYYYW